MRVIWHKFATDYFDTVGQADLAKVWLTFAGDTQVMNQTLDELDELATEVFPGYCPHYYLSYAQCLLMRDDGHQQELVADLIRRARRMGELSGNPWLAKAADYL